MAEMCYCRTFLQPKKIPPVVRRHSCPPAFWRGRLVATDEHASFAVGEEYAVKLAQRAQRLQAVPRFPPPAVVLPPA
eukprot:s315_g2.t1